MTLHQHPGGIFADAISASQGIPIAASQPNPGIFAQPQPRSGIGGILDRINQASATPAFGLGIGLLSGSPQQGFANAQNARAMQNNELRQAMAQRALQQKAQAAAAQRSFSNNLATRADLRAEDKVNKGPSAVEIGRFVHPDDPKAARLLAEKIALKSGVTINTGDRTTPFPPAVRPNRTAQPPSFDAIDRAAGPVDFLARVSQRNPILAPFMGETGTDQRKSRLIFKSIENDIRSSFVINPGRVSNFDLELAGKLLPASLGVFTSEQSSVADLTQLLTLLEADIAQNLEASKSPLLTLKARSDIQIVVNSLANASDKIDGLLTARMMAVTKIGGRAVANIPVEELENLDPDQLDDDQLRAVVAARKLNRAR